MKKNNKVFLEHILDSIKQIEIYTKSLTLKKFSSSHLLQDAVIRNIIIIGEAVTNIEKAFKKSKKNIPWDQIISTRNIVVHEYFGVDLNLTWEIIKEDIPKLKKSILKIVNQ